MILKPLRVNINTLVLAKDIRSKYQFVILKNMHLNFILTPSNEYSPFHTILLVWLSSQGNFCRKFHMTWRSYIQHPTGLLKWHSPFEITVRSNITFVLVHIPVQTQQIRGLGESGRFDMYVDIWSCHARYWITCGVLFKRFHKQNC